MGGAATSSTNGCSHSHTASQLRLHMQSQTAREGERRGECEHQMCADHTLCMVCSHHPKSHTLTVTTPCRWHVNRQGGRRGREKRRGRAAHSFPPSHIQLAHTTPHLLLTLFLSSHLSPSHPPSMLTSSPPPIWLPTHSTPLLLPLNLPLLTHTHTHVPILTHCMCQCTEDTQQQQQQPHFSRSSPPPPAAHVLLHLHATPVSTSSKVACVSEMACFLFLSSSLLFVAPSPHPPHHLCTGSAAWWRTHLLH